MKLLTFFRILTFVNSIYYVCIDSSKDTCFKFNTRLINRCSDLETWTEIFAFGFYLGTSGKYFISFVNKFGRTVNILIFCLWNGILRLFIILVSFQGDECDGKFIKKNSFIFHLLQVCNAEY